VAPSDAVVSLQLCSCLLALTGGSIWSPTWPYIRAVQAESQRPSRNTRHVLAEERWLNLCIPEPT
jgi:hypothetical protein